MSAIDDYLEGLSDSQRAELERIRRIVSDRVPNVEEGRSYGMPAFRYKQKPLLGFAALKNHLSLFPFSPHVVDAVSERLAGMTYLKALSASLRLSRFPRMSSGKYLTFAWKKSGNCSGLGAELA